LTFLYIYIWHPGFKTVIVNCCITNHHKLYTRFVSAMFPPHTIVFLQYLDFVFL